MFIKQFIQVIKNEKGLTLVEVLVALAILGLVGVIFLSGLGTSFVTTTVNQERIDAEGLAKSQMEYVKSQDYDDVHNPPQYAVIAAGSIPPGYFIAVIAQRLDPLNDGTGNDDGIQKITVNVYKGQDAGGQLLITLVGYKVKL